jgi:hypothetical protein
MEKLADGDHTDRGSLVAYGRFDGIRRALRFDQNVGVDQDGQCGSGRRSKRRASITSSAN